MSFGRSKIAILGGGRAGCAFHAALKSRHQHVSLLWTPSEATAVAARSEGFPAVSGPLPESVKAADVVLLAVSDHAVPTLATHLAHGQLVREGAVVAHLAGSLDLSPLAPLTPNASVGSLHPLTSIASRTAPLAGAACAVDANDVRAAAVLEAMARDLGLAIIRPRGDRARYHAAACLVGNYPQVLMEAAIRLFAMAGLNREEARRALGPLLLAAARNAVDKDGAASLSGPIVRGDLQAVERHLATLSSDERLADVEALYRAAGVVAAEMTGEKAAGIAKRLKTE